MFKQKIRVLIVDDSALMRKRLSAIVNSDDSCEVIATARNGEEAIKMVSAFHPDVVTLDIELPQMDGMSALKLIMKEYPVPVIIVSAYSNYRGIEVIKCLEIGAVDVVSKPGGAISLDIDQLKHELLAKVKAASQINLSALQNIPKSELKTISTKENKSLNKIVVIGSSTGGPKALVEILPKLATDIPAGILVVQHMPIGFTHAMAERLNTESKIHVKEAEEGELFKKGTAFVAPGGFHLVLTDNEKRAPLLRLAKGEKQNGVCPSIDVTMKSAAAIYKNKSMGVVLTGMGSDGTEGLRAIKESGGVTLAQDAASSIVFGMPKSAYQAGVVDKMVSLSNVAQEIARWLKE